jgi:drug/metabolite transporter (DMT)-like permease
MFEASPSIPVLLYAIYLVAFALALGVYCLTLAVKSRRWRELGPLVLTPVFYWGLMWVLSHYATAALAGLPAWQSGVLLYAAPLACLLLAHEMMRLFPEKETVALSKSNATAGDVV